MIFFNLIKHCPLQRVMKRSHDISSINTLPFAHPFGLHLLAPQMRPSSSEPSPRHYHTTPRPLRFMAACLPFFHFNHLFSAEGDRGDRHSYSWLWQGGRISERSTGALAVSCRHTLIHLRSGAAHTPFSCRQTTPRKMAFKDTKAPCGGDLPIIAQGCKAGV